MLPNAMRDNGLAADLRAVHLSRLDSLNMLLRHPFGKATHRSRHRPHPRPGRSSTRSRT